MADPRLRDVEELVQACVFHPSPCRRLRTRVIKNAVQARHRQKIGRQAAAAAVALGAVIAILCAVVAFCTSGSAVPTADGVAGSSQVPAKSAKLPDSPAIRQFTGESHGEALYRGDGNASSAGASGEMLDEGRPR